MKNARIGPDAPWSRLVLLLLALLLSPARAVAGLEVLEVGERSLDGAPALAVVLSRPLDPAERFDQHLAVRDETGAVPGGAWVLADNLRALLFPGIEPETTYTVTIAAGLRAADGASLGRGQRSEVTTRAIAAGAYFASQGLVLPGELARGLPVGSVNVEAVDIEFLRVAPERAAAFLDAFRPRASTGLHDLDRMSGFSEPVYSGRFELPVEPNRRATTLIPVRDLPALARPGLYVAVMREPGRYRYEPATAYFFVSDIGLMARLYPTGLGVYASSLADAGALAGVRVELHGADGTVLDRAVTDGEGRVRLAFDPQARLLLARRGEDLALLPLDGPALDLSEFEVAGRRVEARSAFLWSSRDLYRPGERVPLSALLRDHDGRAVPAQALAARLVQPDGRIGGEWTWRPRELGYYGHDWRIPATAQTGTWTLEVRADPAAEGPLARLGLQVEEFEPERLRLHLGSARDTLAPGERMEVAVEGEWLHGAPAAGARLDAVAAWRPEAEPLARLPGFRFGDLQDLPRAGREELERLALDEAGEAMLSYTVPAVPPAAPLRLALVASLLEPGGRAVTRTVEALVWPAPALVGVRPEFDPRAAKPRSTVRFEVVRANAEGVLLAAPALEATLIREEREWFWVQDEQRGWRSEFTENHYPVDARTLAVPAGGRAALAFAVEHGRYRLEVLDPETGRVTRLPFHAGWGHADPQAEGRRPDQVSMELDRAAYRAGDTAVLTLRPPHAGEALVLVESDELLWSTRLVVEGGPNEVRIPVAADWDRHDLYVSAVVLRPAGPDRLLTPNRALGVVHLPLERGDRRLDLAVEVPERIRPQSRLPVRLRAPSARGETVQVRVAAVDVGVLGITGFETPDPAGHFHAKGRFPIDVHDLYGRVIEGREGRLGRLRFGGDAVPLAGGPRPEARVDIVSLDLGPVTLDAAGEAQLDLPVPWFNGRLRVMAVAFGAERFGSAEAEVGVVAPVVAALSMPRFLAPGDASELTVELTESEGHPRDLALALRAEGPLVLGDAPARLRLEPGERRVLRVPLLAGEGFGTARVRLALAGEDLAVGLDRELAVRPPWPGELRRQRARLAPGEAVTLDPGLLGGLMPASVVASLEVADRPPLDLSGTLERLLAYPYGCLEQITSRAWPLVHAEPGLLVRLGLEPLAGERRRTWIAEAIEAVRGLQRPGGGFALWAGDTAEQPWLTPQVVDFLLDARAAGHRVPDAMLDPALGRLARQLRDSWVDTGIYTEDPAHLTFASRAYAGWVLSRVGQAPLGSLRVLHDQERSRAASGLPLVHLGLALLNQGDHRRALEALGEALAKPRGGGYLGDYGSELRDAALIVHLLEGIEDPPPGLEEAVFALADTLAGRRWLSTQEQAALLLAARSLAAGERRPWEARWHRPEASEPVASEGPWRRRLDAAALAGGRRLENTTDRALYLQLAVEGHAEEAPAASLEGPLVVERRWYHLDGTPLGTDPLRVGDRVLVRLRVASGVPVEHGLVVDLLPGGLETENANLTRGEVAQDLRVEEGAVADLHASTRHLEYREDRFVAALAVGPGQGADLFYLARAVTPGRYRVPPPFVEDMYRPAIRALGRASDPLDVVP